MAEPLKDNIDGQLVDLLAARVAERCSDFDTSGFAAAVMSDLGQLELKDRIALIADALSAHLTGSYPEDLDIVVAVAESEVGEWASWPLCSFVERHGLDHPAESLAAMPTLTKYWSCEFAIRPFLENHLEATRAHLRRWVEDPDPAVRRLASEGTRPILPWGTRVPALLEDPEIGLELIRELRHDPDEVVRRSVANHLNDVAKAHPDLVVELAGAWADDGVDAGLLKHALRTLVKRGHAGALAALGFTVDGAVEIVEFECTPAEVELGAAITLTAELRSTSTDHQLLAVDFVIDHPTAAGGRSVKVFKWTTVAPGSSSTVVHLKTLTDLPPAAVGWSITKSTASNW